MADIPGLLPGAAAGVGLGARFLRHLRRTRLLLHLIELPGAEGGAANADALAESVITIAAELAAFDGRLAALERWLVLTKADLVPAEEAGELGAQLSRRLDWRAPMFTISALTGQGTAALAAAAMRRLEQQAEAGFIPPRGLSGVC